MTANHSPRFDDLLPAYALGALEGEELRELQAHLAAGCPACELALRQLAADLEELAALAALAAMAAEVPEPLAGEVPEMLATAKRRLLDQLPQLPLLPLLPLVTAEPRTAAPALAAPPAAQPLTFGRRPAAPAAQGAATVSPRRWPLQAAAAVLAAVAIWGLVRQASMGAEIERLQGERRQLAAEASALERRVEQMQAESERLARTLSILAAPNVQSVSLAGMGTSHSAVGRAYIDTAARQAVFYAANLPALGADKTYQLWYLDDEEQKTSAGTFAVDPHGKATLIIDQRLPVERIQGWVVTIEPRGGRPQPTGPMALAG